MRIMAACKIQDYKTHEGWILQHPVEGLNICQVNACMHE